MITGYSPAQIRTAERPHIDRGEPLMERAAFAVALAARGLLAKLPKHRRSVSLLVGTGNNGGDALFAGAYLARAGVPVTGIVTGAKWHEVGGRTLLAAGGTLLVLDHDDVRDAGRDQRWGSFDDAVSMVCHSGLVVDGLVGTGANSAASSPAPAPSAFGSPMPGTRGRGLRGPARELVVEIVRRTQQSDLKVLAVDFPSGIDAHTGEVPEPDAVLHATTTVTFAAAKTGMLLAPASRYLGNTIIAPIGIEDDLPDPEIRRWQASDLKDHGALAPPLPTDNKYKRGVVGFVAGSKKFPGAALLATSAAVRAGAGLVRYLGPRSVAHLVVANRPEVVPAVGRVQAWVIGPGIAGKRQLDRARTALMEAGASANAGLAEPSTPIPAVVDAGAIALISVCVPPSVVITPHAGELAALLVRLGGPKLEGITRADIEERPVHFAAIAQRLTGATVVLKGDTTVVVGQKCLWSQTCETSWLATAGTGDVLAGTIGALLARHSADIVARPELAAELAAAGVLIHGSAAAAASGGGPIAALDVANQISRVIANALAWAPSEPLPA